MWPKGNRNFVIKNYLERYQVLVTASFKVSSMVLHTSSHPFQPAMGVLLELLNWDALQDPCHIEFDVLWVSKRDPLRICFSLGKS